MGFKDKALGLGLGIVDGFKGMAEVGRYGVNSNKGMPQVIRQALRQDDVIKAGGKTVAGRVGAYNNVAAEVGHPLIKPGDAEDAFKVWGANKATKEHWGDAVKNFKSKDDKTIAPFNAAMAGISYLTQGGRAGVAKKAGAIAGTAVGASVISNTIAGPGDY